MKAFSTFWFDFSVFRLNLLNFAYFTLICFHQFYFVIKLSCKFRSKIGWQHIYNIHTVYKKQRQLFKSKIPINLIPETRMPVTRVPKQFREIQQERENFEKYDARFFQISRKRNFDKYDTRFSSDFTKTKFRGTLIVCGHPLYIENVSFFKICKNPIRGRTFLWNATYPTLIEAGKK